MKFFFSILLVMAVLNPFCCCWSAALKGAEPAEAVHGCCGGGEDESMPMSPQKEDHDPGDCPQQNWMKSKHLNAEVKAPAPVLLDLHVDLLEMTLLFVEDWESNGWMPFFEKTSLKRRPPPVQQLYCVRLL